MKSLKMRVHPVTVVLALAVVLLAVFFIYSRKLESQNPPLGPEELRLLQRPMPAPAYDEALGVVLQVIPESKQEKVVGFRPSRQASPLGLLGCMPGDVLVSINGKPVSGKNVRQAMEDLEKKKKPISLIIERGGQRLELKHTKMPTAPPPIGPSGMPQLPSKPTGK